MIAFDMLRRSAPRKSNAPQWRTNLVRTGMVPFGCLLPRGMSASRADSRDNIGVFAFDLRTPQ
ncbi:hypothetical protein [Denitromonas ohlonensis]|uniref:Uncharacterized protein n=2 Tax=Denitromonas TaxID=139331 RepID=A0A557SBD8_9RHOO|nr:hypothetical protein [Denitromonas ohlonensis]TVO68452.1 hypothetical protein FHP90_04020 [Denitromonas ohlonensis]TVO74730.1 hypothetical protein FHP89_15570 [Denitromonas ohlonensis]TVT72251.1 MAG: hypothetical protein FHP92_16140 [Denitromonas halophila]